ncbi:MAG: arginyltransferase, partial [Brevundimonas sp.]
LERRSLGVFAVLDHLRQAELIAAPYVYLGYWVQGSTKMDYKGRFRPMEVLRPLGWTLVV